MEHQFLRNEMLWGRSAQQRLAASHVILFGLGGVGSYTAECLARSGIGELTLVDQDTVGVSNLNRQLESLHSTLGQPKASAVAARLLDNEALGADYQVATVEDILRDHVAPYGIETVRGAELPPVPGFSVDAGSSEWQVVYEFCRYYGGIAPRFDRLGRLVLAPWEEGRRLVLGADAAVTSFRLREQRYGVLSEVLVRDRTTEEVQRVADEDFLRRGGRCRRVLTMPGKSSYQAMRYSGAYQLARAREELRQAELELPEAFAAWPGELVELNLAKGTGRGLWRVRESVCGLTAAGTYTRLTLGEP